MIRLDIVARLDGETTKAQERIGVINAYIWNSKFVFSKGKDKLSLKLIRIYASYGLAFLLSTGFLFLMVDLLGISEMVAPVINLFIITPINFLLNKFWVFR